MSKRNSSLENQNQKRTKFDDFWDDDIDENLIEDCFNQASQVVCDAEQERNEQAHSVRQNDVTLLSSYSIFKEPGKGMVTSTQSSQYVDSKSIETRLSELREKYAEKEGEVSILRANMQKLKASCQAEQEKKENEWKDKLNMTQKENKSIRSELEFKNLEIANLKQRIAEVSRHIFTEQNGTQNVRNTDIKNAESPKKVLEKVTVSNPKIQVSSQRYYPLKHLNFSLMFESDLEGKTAVSYSENQSGHEEAIFFRNLMTETVFTGEQKFGVDHVCPQLAYLINLSEDELNAEQAVVAIKKVVYVSLQLLTSFYNHLKQIEENLQLQDVQRLDAEILQQNGKSHFKKFSRDIKCMEIMTKSAKVIGFLSEILPFSSYLRNCLLRNRFLNVRDNEDLVNLLASANIPTREQLIFLRTLLNLISIIGRTRKEQFCTVFLSSVIKLLHQIFSNCQFIDSKNIIHEITIEMLFLRPNYNIIFEITYLLKLASRHADFIDLLCCESDKINVIKSNATNKGVLNFTKESCRFSMLASLLQNALSRTLKEDLVLQISSNVLIFVFNIFRSNTPRLYQREDRKCNCLCLLCKLSINVIYRNLKILCQEKKSVFPIYSSFFKNSIQILNLLTFNSYDLTQKYMTEFAQFKEIVYTLNQLQNEVNLDKDILKNLEKLDSAGADVSEIPYDKFKGIEL